MLFRSGTVISHSVSYNYETWTRLPDSVKTLLRQVAEDAKKYDLEKAAEAERNALENMKKNGVEIIAGSGTLVGGGAIDVTLADDGGVATGEHRRVSAADIIVATGSSVRRIPGLETDGRLVVSSDEVVTGTFAPKRVIVVGGGAVGCEFAS